MLSIYVGALAAPKPSLAAADTAEVGAGPTVPGGGGGSFDAGLNQILVAGFQAGNGEIMITELAPAVPEPSSLAMVGTGLAGLTGLAAMRRRSKT